MAKIIVFGKKDFKGGNTQIYVDSVPTLKGSGLNDDVSSVIVLEGNWKLFEKAHFDPHGGVWGVKPNGGQDRDGAYKSYQDWRGQNNKISSIELVE
ncbi:MAG: beta/gamma crystallin-related protein [Chloroflexota bacterium]